MRTLATLIACLVASAAYADQGTLIVLNKAEATASLISLATGEEVRRVPTGQGPHEVAVSPDGRMAVVADYGAQEHGHSLTVIDIAAGEAATTIELAGHHRPHGIEFLDDRRVIVTTELEKAVVVVDLQLAKVVNVIETGQEATHMVAVAPDGTRAFATSIGSGTMTAIDLSTMEVLEHVETGAGAEGVAVSPDGREVWVANRAANTITVIDARSLDVLQQIDCGDFPIRLEFAPHGRHVLVSNARSADVAVFDAKSRQEIARVKIDAAPEDGAEMLGAQGAVPIGIQMTPGGERAYVAAANADVVAVIELGSWTLGEALKAGREPDGMGWSPVEVGAAGQKKTTQTYGS